MSLLMMRYTNLSSCCRCCRSAASWDAASDLICTVLGTLLLISLRSLNTRSADLSHLPTCDDRRCSSDRVARSLLSPLQLQFANHARGHVSCQMAACMLLLVHC